MQILHTKYYWHYCSISEVMPESVTGPVFFRYSVFWIFC